MASDGLRIDASVSCVLVRRVVADIFRQYCFSQEVYFLLFQAVLCELRLPLSASEVQVIHFFHGLSFPEV